MLRKKITAVALSCAMLLSSLPFAVFADTPEYATRGQIADMLLEAADDYTPVLTRTDIIKGYPDGTTMDDQTITRAESFVMVSRAFGKLPAPTGDNQRLALPDPAFDGVPDWAKEDVQNLCESGIIIGSPDGLMHGDDLVTTEQITLMIQRIWALLGSNLKDDFYAAVNKEWLDKSTLLPGSASTGAFTELNDENNKRLTGMIQDIVSSTPEKGTKEQKIKDFYLTILDSEGRAKTGLAPIQEYLDKVDALENLDQLKELQALLTKEFCLNTLLGFGITVDLKNSNQYILVFSTISPDMTKDFYSAGNEASQKLYTDYLQSVLELGGVSPEEAQRQITAYYDLQKDLAANSLGNKDMNNVDKIYNIFTLDQLQEKFPAFDLKQILKNDGIEKVPEKIMVGDVGLMEAAAKYYTQDNFQLLKDIMRLSLLSSFGGYLDDGFTRAATKFSNALYGIEGERTAEENASLTVQGVMSDYLGEAYIERYFSPEAKRDVENMVQDFIEIYKTRISNLDWMSDTTKEKALKKLETMGVRIGYPDSWETPMDEVEIKGIDQGGSYFGNVLEMTKASFEQFGEMLDQPVDKNGWALNVYTVNAYYDPTANQITFPAGILQAPFYDIDAQPEANFGAIGAVIAHEITHAFDNNGAKFDEKGNAADWWTAEDYEQFQKLCEKVESFYDGQEAYAGIINNGSLTLSENIADLGGLSCALEAVSKLDSPDYKVFFESFATIWRQSSTREAMQYTSTVDVHSINKIRTNRSVVNFDEFYKAFDIGEKDGMYVAPEDRVRIW